MILNSATKSRPWRWTQLAALQGGGAILYLSWLFGPLRPLWDAVDHSIFYFLNGSLRSGEVWQLFWAVANNRLFDLLPAGLMCALFTHYVRAGRDSEEKKERFAMVLFSVVLIAVSVPLVADLFCDMNRKSPTMVLEDSVRLSKLFPNLPLKDASFVSFPGDHTSVLMLFAACIWRYGGLGYGLLGVVMVVLFSMPRLIGGGHWFTDDVVGGGFIFLTASAWAFASPLHGWAEGLARKIAAKIL